MDWLYYNPHVELVTIYRNACDIELKTSREIPNGHPHGWDYEALDLWDVAELVNATVGVDD